MDSLRKILIRLNNWIVSLLHCKYKPEQTMILVPHCMQNSDCQVKIVDDVRNCKGCGKCPAAELFDLAQKFEVNLFVASGGTLARQTVKRLKIKAIVAVACERELFSGILGCLPRAVLAVVNQRPNGPCRDTTLEISEVKEALKFFLK